VSLPRLTFLSCAISRHQRVGILEPLLGEARDVLQMGRQPDRSKMALDRVASACEIIAELCGKLPPPAPCRRQRLRAWNRRSEKPGRSLPAHYRSVAQIDSARFAVQRSSRGRSHLGAAGGRDGVLARRAAEKMSAWLASNQLKKASIARAAVVGTSA